MFQDYSDNKSIYLQIAGFNIKILSKTYKDMENIEITYKNIKITYKGFLLSGEPKKIDYYIILWNDSNPFFLRQGKKNFLFFYEQTGFRQITVSSPLTWIHFSILLRVILSDLLQENGFLLHASASIINSKAVIFLGKSGAGKSTVTQLLKPKYRILADDTIIIRKENNTFYLYQTPFIEKHSYLKTNHKYLILSINFLKKEKICKLKKVVNSTQIRKQFFSQLYSEKKYLSKDIKIVLEFLAKFQAFYILFFSKEPNSLFKSLKIFR